MNKFDFIKRNNVHFIGIGGISMSGLASILLNAGFLVTGSDRTQSKITNLLEENGATIFIGSNKNNVVNADFVVYTAAISDEDPELVQTRNLNIPYMDRAEFLGELMKSYDTAITVSGMHGKTSTTSLLSLAMIKAGIDPTVLVGGIVSQIDDKSGNYKIGNSQYFITEACEYKGSFLKFFPTIAIILNMDMDHPDYFRDFEHVKDTFREYADRVPIDGTLIGCYDDENVRKLLDDAKCNTLSYGLTNDADWYADEVTYNDFGCASYNVYYKDSCIGNITLQVPGVHNVYNSLASCIAGYVMGLPMDNFLQSLSDYTGVDRRFQLKGKVNGVTVIDEYAHHPTEINAALSSAKNYPHNRIICIFQPHTYTRTHTLFNDFVDSLTGIDQVVLVGIYSAREKDTNIVSSKMLADAIADKGQSVTYIENFDKCVQFLKNTTLEGDLVITMGAGDVYKIGEDFINL